MLDLQNLSINRNSNPSAATSSSNEWFGIKAIAAMDVTSETDDAPAGGKRRELIRQQWTFSPQGSTGEVEDTT